MAPRAIWRGAISFGMVSIPVRLYTATESKDISFRQLAEEDLQPVKQLRWSPTLDREVEYGDMVRGYEYAKDQYVILTDEDFESLPVPSKQILSITQFVEQTEIDPIFYEKAYYLDPDDTGKKPYALLYRAMEEKGLIALGKIALRQKEQLVAIRPQEGHLIAELLLYPDEVRPYEGTDTSGVEVSSAELDMALALIDMLHAPFEPERYTDEYREKLLAMITAKLEGGEVVAAEQTAEPMQTVDLMAALRASVEAARSRQDGDEAAAEAATAKKPARKQRSGKPSPPITDTSSGSSRPSRKAKAEAE